MNPLGVPGIDVHQFAEKQSNGDKFILLDVRDPLELQTASLGEAAVNVPLSMLAKTGPSALPDAVTADKSAEIVIMCHHGSRSAQVASWLTGNGWTNVINLDGGIHAYAKFIDPSIPTY